ncbi:MAG: hypothetical protein ACERKD_16095 [Prolixibacteraceae bacterium]
MKRGKIIKSGILIAIVIIAGGIGLYLFNMPHRDVQSTDADFSVSSTEIVNEYLNNAGVANEKYLSSDGDSKILVISGTVHKITEDFSGKQVILLKELNDNAGVSCTFIDKIKEIEALPGKIIKVKGVIHAGASYDADMELFQDVVLSDCTIIN